MNVKYTIPGIYRANTLSLCAWIWIESAMYCQDGDRQMTVIEAARQFQKFWGLDEDEMDIYHIRTCYYRMQEANRERKEDPQKFPAEPSTDLLKALIVIKEFMNQKAEK